MALVELEDLKAYLQIPVENTLVDARLTALIGAVGRAVELYCRRHFDLRTETHYFDFQDRRDALSIADDSIYARRRYLRKLWLDGDLHSLTQLTNGDQAIIPLQDVVLYPLQGPPYRWIELRQDKSSTFVWNDTPQRALAVTGKWGYQTAESREIVPQAIRMWVSQLHAAAEGAGISSKSIGDFSVSFKDIASPFSDATGQVIKPPFEIALLLDGLRKRDIAAAGVSW